MQIALKEYKKSFDYSYSSGVFATLELLKYRPKEVIRVFINSKGAKNKGLDEIKEICRKHNIPVETADGLVIKLSHSENCYAVGVFNKYKTQIDGNKNHMVLVNPSDMGNMGTIIRTMVGFEVLNLALIRPAADIYDPKVIRSSTGSFFQINFQYFNDIEEYIKTFANQNYYTFMLEGKITLDSKIFKEPFSLLFGNEGSGLPKEYANLGHAVSIPHSKNIDSLNLSIAVGVTLFEACKNKF